MLRDDILREHFDRCFPIKNDSGFRKYVEILENKAIHPKTDNRSPKRKQNEEDNSILKDGYLKWKIIPRMHFKTKNLNQDLSNNRENIVFLKPEHYFLSSYLLMLYFHDIGGNEILEAFFYRRLKDILQRKNPDLNNEDRTEYLRTKNRRKAILYKIRNRNNLTSEDYATIREIFEKMGKNHH